MITPSGNKGPSSRSEGDAARDEDGLSSSSTSPISKSFIIGATESPVDRGGSVVEAGGAESAAGRSVRPAATSASIASAAGVRDRGLAPLSVVVTGCTEIASGERVTSFAEDGSFTAISASGIVSIATALEVASDFEDAIRSPVGFSSGDAATVKALFDVRTIPLTVDGACEEDAFTGISDAVGGEVCSMPRAPASGKSPIREGGCLLLVLRSIVRTAASARRVGSDGGIGRENGCSHDMRLTMAPPSSQGGVGALRTINAMTH